MSKPTQNDAGRLGPKVMVIGLADAAGLDAGGIVAGVAPGAVCGAGAAGGVTVIAKALFTQVTVAVAPLVMGVGVALLGSEPRGMAITARAVGPPFQVMVVEAPGRTGSETLGTMTALDNEGDRPRRLGG